jgi:Rod binding domain-containing protein
MNVSALQSPAASTPGADNPRLKSAAHEFEASLMQEFLKPLQHDALFSSGETGSDTDSDANEDSGSDGALMSFGSQAMAKEISERGGFGIATKILDHFRTSPASQVLGSATKL